MRSGSNETSDDLSSVKGDIEANASTIRDDETLASLRERLDAVELLVEEVGRTKDLQDEVTDYVADLKAELNDLKNFRWWVTAFSAGMSVALFLVLLACVISRPDWFMALDGPLQVSVLAGLGAASVFLMSMLLKGVYRTRQDRNNDEILPEHLRQVVDTFKS
jgi:hypothetical protein